MPVFSNEQIRVFLSLFRGREDVFAIRWEKDSKAGYMPAYDLNWDEFAKHKLRGGKVFIYYKTPQCPPANGSK